MNKTITRKKNNENNVHQAATKNKMNKNIGLAEFTLFYDQNSGLSGVYKAPITPVYVTSSGSLVSSIGSRGISGIEQVMLATQKLPCYQGVSTEPIVPIFNSSDHEIFRYNVFKGRKEKCGCGGVAFPLPKF